MKHDKQIRNYPFLYQGVVLIILLLAAGLRFAKLDEQSFWNDEGNTARLVERTIPLIIEGAAGDVHPPGYYLILHTWRLLTGETEFALRSYSALCGILTVALTVAVTRQLTSEKSRSLYVVLPALWYVTLNPLAVYYSQEARMYAQLGVAASSLLWVAILFQKTWSLPSEKTTRRQRVFQFILLALTVAFGLYTHYAFVFVLVSLSCAYGLYWLIYDFKRWRSLLVWVGAFVVGGILFLPWAPVALRASGWHPPDLSTTAAIQSMLRTLVVGVTLPQGNAIYVLPVLVIFGTFIMVRLPHSPFAAWASFAGAFFPAILIGVFGIYRPAYLKFLIISICPLAVSLSFLTTVRLANSKRVIWTIFLLLAFTPAQVKALQHLYNNPVYARDNYRGIVDVITAEARSGDAVLLNAPNQWEVFTYYYRGELPILTAPYHPTEQETAAWVQDIVENYNQLFVLYWGDTEADPERFVEVTLAQKAFKANEVWVSTVRLARYGTGVSSVIKPVKGISVGEMIKLTGYSLPDEEVSPGDILPVTLIWKTDVTPQERYKVFVHLVNDAGLPVAQADSEPGGGFHLTNLWVAGDEVRDNYGVLIPGEISPGRYAVRIGMYDFLGQRLPISRNGVLGDDSLLLDSVIVELQQ